MAIKTIEILNVMVFKRHLRKNNAALKSIEEGDSFNDGFKIEFCDGINVLIGENGVGKTTILKMIYAATQWSIKQTDQGKTKRLIQFFSNSLKDSDALKNAENKEDYCYYKVSDGTHNFEDSLSHKGIFNYDQWLGLDIQSVFIPTTEMLSHAKGFLAMNQKYNMPFDGTQIDIIVNASLPETREIPFAMSKILDKLSAVIDGTVILENDSFYVLKKDGQKVDFSLEAEGLRKLGLLWKLMDNVNPDLYDAISYNRSRENSYMQQMMAYIDKCEMLAGIVEQEPLTSTESEKILVWANEQFIAQEWEDATSFRKAVAAIGIKMMMLYGITYRELRNGMTMMKCMIALPLMVLNFGCR